MSSEFIGSRQAVTNDGVLSAGVLPTLLCSACLCIYSGDPARFEYKDEMTRSWNQNIFPHHDTLGSFQAAAKEGCYICSRVDAQLRGQIEDTLGLDFYGDACLWELPFSTYEMHLDHDMGASRGKAELFIRIIKFVSSCRQSLDPCRALRQVGTWLESCTWSDDTCSRNSDDLSPSRSTQSFGESYHMACTHNSISTYMPTRLLYLGDTSSETWRICVPSEDRIDAVAYTTTSYRWGDVPFLKLTQQLLPDFRAGAPLSQLPQTFQDVIIVTKRLGFQYIWIDALCIIQDSEEDFKNEIAKMADIYSNTAVNIIAAACENPFESLFNPRHLSSCHVGRTQPSWDAVDPLFATLHSIDSIIETQSIQREFDNAPTNSRGWILQERVLPPRRLYFFRTQLYYVCRSSEFCEVFPEEVPLQIRSDCLIHDLPPSSQRNSTFSGFNRWMNLAEDYSKCSFTYPKDKMIALSGLVKVFQRATGDDYVAGLWKSRLPWTLGWSGKVDSPRRRSALDIAPTWSWLSIDGEIRYNERDYRGEHATALCEILNVSVMPVVVTSSDTVVPGLLTLRALSFHIYASTNCHLNVPFLSDDLKENLRFNPDDTYEDIAADTRLIMAILTVDAFCANFLDEDPHAMEGPTGWCIEALVLKYDEAKGPYRRVGMLSITTGKSESQARKSPLLEAFGLTIKDTFGEVVVTDNNNWTVLRVI